MGDVGGWVGGGAGTSVPPLLAACLHYSSSIAEYCNSASSLRTTARATIRLSPSLSKRPSIAASRQAYLHAVVAGLHGFRYGVRLSQRRLGVREDDQDVACVRAVAGARAAECVRARQLHGARYVRQAGRIADVADGLRVRRTGQARALLLHVRTPHTNTRAHVRQQANKHAHTSHTCLHAHAHAHAHNHKHRYKTYGTTLRTARHLNCLHSYNVLAPNLYAAREPYNNEPDMPL